MLEFKEWPKTPRLNRGMIVTEKIDGTNAAVIVKAMVGEGYGFTEEGDIIGDIGEAVAVRAHDQLFLVAAQSRKRLIAPGKQTDNAGFAAWVRANAQKLTELLGEGYHYGEWWGKGIQHGYGQDGKRFSLFNVVRYAGVADEAIGLDTVPVLYEGDFYTAKINMLVEGLRRNGSVAAPGQPAEGIIVFHKAAGCVFKVTCEKDEAPKGAHNA
jgi:hypothetical protein